MARAPSTTCAVPGGPATVERAGLAAHDPVGRDDVVEVADVVAVQVGQQHPFEHHREDAGCDQAHADASPGVDQEPPGAGPHQGGGAGPVGIGSGLPVPSRTTESEGWHRADVRALRRPPGTVMSGDQRRPEPCGPARAGPGSPARRGDGPAAGRPGRSWPPGRRAPRRRPRRSSRPWPWGRRRSFSTKAASNGWPSEGGAPSPASTSSQSSPGSRNGLDQLAHERLRLDLACDRARSDD